MNSFSHINENLTVKVHCERRHKVHSKRRKRKKSDQLLELQKRMPQWSSFFEMYGKYSDSSPEGKLLKKTFIDQGKSVIVEKVSSRKKGQASESKITPLLRGFSRKSKRRSLFSGEAQPKPLTAGGRRNRETSGRQTQMSAAGALSTKPLPKQSALEIYYTSPIDSMRNITSPSVISSSWLRFNLFNRKFMLRKSGPVVGSARIRLLKRNSLLRARTVSYTHLTLPTNREV